MTMESKNTLEIEAPTVREAVARGLEQLGLSREQVEITVLEEGRVASVGTTGIPARVRLAALGSDVSEDAELETARTVVQDIIGRMRIRARTTVAWMDPEDSREARHVLVEIHGQDLGILVTRRGEALTALQYLTRLIAGQRVGHPLPVVVDVEGYRRRREQQLRRMARRAAEQAVERGRTIVLEPMPANERRIIHIELRDEPGVTTESVGIGRQRKVTIIPGDKAEASEVKSG